MDYKYTAYDRIIHITENTVVFDSLDDNYHEFDRQKLLTLYDAIGIPENMQAAI